MPRLVMATHGGSELELSIAPVTDRHNLAEAFTELREPVCRYLLALGLRPAEAEEVVQETFLRLCQHLDSQGPQDNLRGWIFRVAHNLARDEHRRRKRQPSEPLDESASSADPQATPEQSFIAGERTRRLGEALARLPAHQQECLHLRAEGLRYREIAEVLGAGISTVAEWVQDALKTLGKEMR
ncbi:MAG TPA: RNA polymerase sigma factor [Bryobacteraceae bacterium]|nr:RNA polymerase sigma factor [Bryobacteraceae bacterium]